MNNQPRQKQYRYSEQMKINLERAKKLYPHRLITPKGVGNEKEYSQYFRQG